MRTVWINTRMIQIQTLLNVCKGFKQLWKIRHWVDGWVDEQVGKERECHMAVIQECCTTDSIVNEINLPHCWLTKLEINIKVSQPTEVKYKTNRTTNILWLGQGLRWWTDYDFFYAYIWQTKQITSSLDGLI